MRLLLIDDHKMFIDGLAMNLETLPEISSVTIKHCAKSALDHLEEGHFYHLIMLDLNMPDINGFQFMDTLIDRDFYFPIAILSGSENPEDFIKLRDYGISAYISKSSNAEQLGDALSSIANGERVIPVEISHYFDPNFKINNNEKEKPCILPRRKMQILEYMAEGKTNREIAETLFIAKSTVDDHIKEIYRRLEVSGKITCINKAKSLDLL